MTKISAALLPLYLLMFSALFSVTQSWNLVAHARNRLMKQPSSTTKDHDELGERLKVRPGTDAPRVFWRLTWKIHSWSLPLLHAFDKARAQDFGNSLKCLWCKALIGVDRTSPVYDSGITYDMLPSGSRWFVKLPNRIFPRLIHYNLELRTAYLDEAV